MTAFELDVLLWPTCVIFLLSLVISFKVTKMPAMSIFVAFIKSGAFLIYFGLLFDGTFTFLDDWSYLEGGETLLDEGVSLFNMVNNWEILHRVGGGEHVLYYLYNTYAFKLFGVGYFAPVACNIILTIFIAYFGSHLAVKEFGFSIRQGKWFYLFLLFQPDIFAWSNIMNGKDILVLLLHLFLLQVVALIYQKQLFYALLVGVPVVMILMFLRFYVPVLFVMTFLLAVVFGKRESVVLYIFYLMLAVVLFGLMFSWVGQGGFQYAFNSIQEKFVNPLYGFVRMLLTPVPFHTEPSYAFLNIPSLFHWLMMPFVILGLNNIRKQQGLFPRFFIIYIFVFMGLYSVFGELQGPRHRVQLEYAFATLQFIGLTLFVKNIKFSLRKRRRDADLCHSFQLGVPY